MKSYNIAIIGTFDVKNYGDLLFPEVLENELKKRLNLNKLYMFSPNGGIKPFTKEKVYPIRDLEKIINDVGIDAIIIGGGNIIRLDKTIARDYKRSYEAAYGLWQVPILLAVKYNIKVLFNAPGVAYMFNISQQRFNKFFLDNVDYLFDRYLRIQQSIATMQAELQDLKSIFKLHFELGGEPLVAETGEMMVYQSKQSYGYDLADIKDVLENVGALEKAVKVNNGFIDRLCNGLSLSEEYKEIIRAARQELSETRNIQVIKPCKQ